MISAGIDCGAKNTKIVILEDGKIVGKAKILTGFDHEKVIRASLDAACQEAGISESAIEKRGGTGLGKDSIKGAVMINDIKAMARGAVYFFPNVGTVIDVGAEEGRVAKLDERGNPVDFAINEKCAAGAGAFIEAMARALETPLEEMGPLALQSNAEIPINAQCAIFAESEVVGLIHAGTAMKDISKAIHDAMANRVVSMVRRVRGNPDFVMIGGVASNPGFVAALKRELNQDRIHIPDVPEFCAAVGAAIVAGEGP